MNFLDLFSGIGGFALGARWAGLRFDKHFFSEIDPFCVDVYPILRLENTPYARQLGINPKKRAMENRPLCQECLDKATDWRLPADRSPRA